MIEQDLSQFSMLDLFRVEAETQALVLTSGRDEPRTDLMTNRDSEPRPRTSAGRLRGQWNGADDGWRQR